MLNFSQREKKGLKALKAHYNRFYLIHYLFINYDWWALMKIMLLQSQFIILISCEKNVVILYHWTLTRTLKKKKKKSNKMIGIRHVIFSFNVYELHVWEVSFPPWGGGVVETWWVASAWTQNFISGPSHYALANNFDQLH